MMLPPILQTFFAKRRPARVKTCTPDNIAAYGIATDCIARDKPETVDETIVRDMLDDIARKGEGQ